MPEHTIPKSLVENIRKGRAAIVVGAGIGVPSWKQLLERMNEELRSRGQDGDEAAAKDVAKLLHKGNLVRAAAFLGRQLGPELCDKIVVDAWKNPDNHPEIAKAIAHLPMRQVWTTFPGSVLELAMEDELPEHWPLPRVLTYKNAHEVDPRRRTLLKILGDFESFIATPMSIRRALSSADSLRDLIKPYYVSGSLLFVGFRYGDPDLAALLDRVFGAFELPESDHYLIAASVGPVTVDELGAEHQIRVINLPGKGTDDTATEALIGFLGELREQCEAEGITLVHTRPDADDLEGWIEILADDGLDREAIAAIEGIEARARENGDAERLVEVLMVRTEVEGTGPGRAALLRQVAEIYENQVGDLPKAFTALTAALAEDPADQSSVDAAERLADEADGWSELVADVAQVAGTISDKALAAEYFTRLGRWYHRKLDHVDYAIASYREALRRVPMHPDACKGLAEAYRVQQRWGELADLFDRQVEVAKDPAVKLDLYLSLGDLCESQLAATGRAVEAYEAATHLEGVEVEDAFVALERLFRQSEHWGKLAKVLDHHADRLEAAGNPTQAAALRRQVTSLRSEKLGDLEGAIGKHEAALEQSPEDREALSALEDLYDKLGRTADYLRVVERLADLASEDERPALLRRLAAELEEQEGGAERAIEALSKLIDLEPGADDAYRSLDRLHTEANNWEALISVLERRAFNLQAPAPRAEVFLRMARVHEQELSDPHKALEALESAVSDAPENRAVLTGLARLYRRTESWQRAADVLAQHAELEGPAGAALWADAGAIAQEQLEDRETAVHYLEKALEFDAANLMALRSLAKLHKAEGAWANAVTRLLDAADACSNRLEKIDLLLQAAHIADDRLGDRDRGLSILQKVLQIDPEHIDAGRNVSERLVAAKRLREAVPVLEMVARRLDPGDRIERARRCAELGRICHELGDGAKAVEHFESALAVEPDNLDAALGLANALYQNAQQGDDVELWQRVDKRYREILARHRTGLADGQAVELWHRLGVAARAMGELGKSEAALRRALEREPNHESTLRVLIEVATQRGDFKTAIDARRDLLEHLAGDERAEALEAIGDLCREKLRDPVTALGAYLEAMNLQPTTRGLLHKTLEIYTEQKQWRQAVTTLDSIATTEDETERRAKYHYAAAVICRDELKDVSLAVQFFAKALEDDPRTPKACDAIEALAAKEGDYKSLARAYQSMLKRMGEDAPVSETLPLWTKLAEVFADKLGDHEAAIAAYEVAVSLDPDDMHRHEVLVDLYLESGEQRRLDAIEELQVLVAHDPDRVELYKALSEQYRAEGETDKSFCVAQALVFLGAASPEETELFALHRSELFVLAQRRLTEELWQKAIIHDREDRHINAIFSSILAPVAATTAQPASAFQLTVGADSDSLPVGRVFRYATGVLGLKPTPNLCVEGDKGEGLRVANTVDNGKLAPTLIVGSPHAGKADERELAFEIGKRLAYFRPERYLNFALQTLPKLESAFYGALVAAGAGQFEDHGDAAAMAAQLKKLVPAAVLEQVGAVAKKMNIDGRNGVVVGWRTATDLTANRVGLILCNDLETAARAVATEKAGPTTLPAKDRLRDLLAYSVSESYFAVRRHLGLSVG